MALASDCLSRPQLRALALAALRGAGTLAADRVYDPHAWPMEVVDLPSLVVTTPAERKESVANGIPQFLTTITLAVLCRVASTDESLVEALLDQLADQVQRAILCTPDMIAPVQQFVFAETHLIVSAEGEQYVGEATVMIGCEVYQLYEPDTGAPLVALSTRIPGGTTTTPPVRFDTPLQQ